MATPYLLCKDTICEKANTPYDGPDVVDMNLYDPRKKERVKIPEITLPKELEGSMKIGSSRGWVSSISISTGRKTVEEVHWKISSRLALALASL